MGERDREHQQEAEIIVGGGLNNDRDKHKARERLRACVWGEALDLGLSVIGFGLLPRCRGDSPDSHTHTHTHKHRHRDTHQAVCGVSVLMCVCAREEE